MIGLATYTLQSPRPTSTGAEDAANASALLGAFQALSHYLADAKTAVDGAETLVFEAAWARSEGRDIARLAPIVKASGATVD